MSQLFDGGDAQKASAAFEGVKGPEHLVQSVFVFRVVLQHQHTLLDLTEQITPLVAKLIEQLQVVIGLNDKARLFGGVVQAVFCCWFCLCFYFWICFWICLCISLRF